MTPLVREMAALVPEPESAHWFDIGVIDAAVPAQCIAWDDVRHLPYARTVTVFVTDKGSRCACWMAAGDHSITKCAGSLGVQPEVRANRLVRPVVLLRSPAVN